MTAVIRTCVAALLGLWIVTGVAQEASEENTGTADAQQEVAPEAASAAAGEAAAADTADQPDVIADEGATEAGATDPGEAFPEVPPLDELFVPSQNIRADEPVTFPVDF
ncbi:MAG: hypothetical protein OXQ29_27755 [Rhodospirillaceae bacterium]|nr:hypothetical protein [Rhodospirillaceae bacterium]